LGVFVCASPRTRRATAHSACARGLEDQCQRRSVCPFFALCSLAKITNFSAILNTHLLVQQQLMRVLTFQVCRTGLEARTHGRRASSSSTGFCGRLRLQINACCQAHP